MNVKTLQINALRALRRSPFDILSVGDIRSHFHYTPTPAFTIDGINYIVRSRFGVEKVPDDQFLAGVWRTTSLVERVLARIARNESYHQRLFPGCYYVVHSAVLNRIPIIRDTGEIYHTDVWRAALVKPQ